MPRTRISESCLISDITGVSTGLVVEVGEDSLEPLLFLCDSESMSTVWLFFDTSTSAMTCHNNYVSHVQEVQIYTPQSQSNPSVSKVLTVAIILLILCIALFYCLHSYSERRSGVT